MAKNKKKITCRAFIRVNGELVNVDTLNEQQKNYLGAKMQEKILNATNKGEAVFTANVPPVEEVFPH